MHGKWRSNNKNCSFKNRCYVFEQECDNEKEKTCEIANEINFAMNAPCEIMKKLRDSGEKISDISCDIQNVRCSIPFGKCVYQGECIRAFVSEVGEACNKKGTKELLSKEERSKIRGSVNIFFQNISA